MATRVVTGWLLVACALVAHAQAIRLEWHPGARMPTGRGGQVVGVVGGKVLHAGGTYWAEGKKFWTADLDIYDPATDTWTKGPPMPFPMSYGGGAAIRDRLYICSGSDGKHSYTETVICARGANRYVYTRGPSLPAPRIECATAVVGDRLYLIGGARDAALSGSFYRDAVVLDTRHPERGWRTVRGFPGPGRTDMAAASVGTDIYIFGGYQRQGDGFRNCDDAFVLDTVRERWRRLPSTPYAARCWNAVAVKGKVLIMGGYVTWPARMLREESFTANTLIFDPQTGTYEMGDPIPYEACGVNPVFLPDGRLMIAGGEDRMRHRTDLVGLATVR